MRGPRSNVAIPNRIDATVGAAKIYEMLRDDEKLHLNLPYGEPWMIIGCLRETVVSHRLIREWLDVILTAEPKYRWRRCWIRRHVAEIEAALGLEHDPRSSEARAAYAAGEEAWKAYTSAQPPPEAMPDCSALPQAQEQPR